MRNKTQERGNLHLFEIRWYRGFAALIEGRYLIEANDSGGHLPEFFNVIIENGGNHEKRIRKKL